MSKNITIVINTINKPRMLYSMLNYHSHIKIQCPIIIIDASDSDILDINRETVSNFKKLLNISHFIPKEKSLFESIGYGLSLVKTSYIIISGDDDYFFNDALIKSAQFLDSNPDFSACAGRAFKLDCSWNKSSKTWQVLSGIDVTPDRFLEEKPSGRILRYTQKLIVPTYAVQRIESLRESFSVITNTEIKDDNGLPEFLFNVNMLINGKMNVLPILYHFWFSPANKRQAASSLHRGFNALHWVDKLLSDKYKSCLNIYLDFTTTQLLKHEKIESNDARNVVLSVWAGYFSNMMQRRVMENLSQFNMPLFEITQKDNSRKSMFFFIYKHISIFKIIKLFRSGLRVKLIKLPWHRDYKKYKLIMNMLRKSMCRSISLDLDDPRQL
jgi:glycosyltransferase domain-containing protein